jgi:hypothetical protein
MSSTLTPAQQRIVDAYVAAEREYRRDATTRPTLVAATAAAKQAGVLGDSVDACTQDRIANPRTRISR